VSVSLKLFYLFRLFVSVIVVMFVFYGAFVEGTSGARSSKMGFYLLRLDCTFAVVQLCKALIPFVVSLVILHYIDFWFVMRLFVIGLSSI